MCFTRRRDKFPRLSKFRHLNESRKSAYFLFLCVSTTEPNNFIDFESGFQEIWQRVEFHFTKNKKRTQTPQSAADIKETLLKGENISGRVLVGTVCQKAGQIT